MKKFLFLSFLLIATGLFAQNPTIVRGIGGVTNSNGRTTGTVQLDFNPGIINPTTRTLVGNWTVGTSLTVPILIVQTETNSVIGSTNFLFLGHANANGFSLTNALSLLGNGSGIISNFNSLSILGDFNLQNSLTNVNIGPGAGAGNLFSYSVSVGPGAGQLAANNSQSTYLGYQAGANATNSSLGVFVGYLAGRDAMLAIRSVFIGNNVARYATNSGSAVFIGNGAGNGASGAANSVFIGRDAGSDAYAATSSIFIGRSCGANLNRSSTLQIEGLVVYGTNTTGTGLIYGEFDTRTLTFNATNRTDFAGIVNMMGKGITNASTFIVVTNYVTVLRTANNIGGAWGVQEIVEGTKTNWAVVQYDGANWYTNSKFTSTLP